MYKTRACTDIISSSYPTQQSKDTHVTTIPISKSTANRGVQYLV